MSDAAVILAAGEGRRFNRDDPGAIPGAKLLYEIGGRAVLARALEPVLESGCEEIVVVAGAADLSGVVPAGVAVVVNENWRAGLASSLAAGLAWCADRGHARALVGLGDQPGLTVEAWRAVRDAPESPLVFARYGERRGHPVRLDAAVWPLLGDHGDEGARALARAHPEWVREVVCAGSPEDIDTREDLERWN